MKRNNNFTISKAENMFINSNENDDDNLDNITSLKELYDHFNSKEYKDKTQKEVFDILNGNIPKKNNNNYSNKFGSRINEKDYKYENKNQSSGLNNLNKVHFDLKSSDKKGENYLNSIENKNNRNINSYHKYQSGNNNFRGWKGRGRGNWRGRGRGRGKGFYRGNWRGRGKYRSFNNYCNLYDNNCFYKNRNENNNKQSETKNVNKEINGRKNNNDCYSNFLNELNNSDSKSEEYDDDDGDNNYYKLFSNDFLLNSLSDLNLNRLFNGLDLIGGDIFEDMGCLTLNSPSFRDELIFNLRESNKGLSKEFVNNLPKIKIDFENKKSINPNKCVICREVFKDGDEIIKVTCHHCFHSNCIMKWFEFSNYCPICRFILDEEEKD